MKALIKTDCSQWLVNRGIVEDPYCNPIPAQHFCDQFRFPHDALKVEYVVRKLVEAAQPFGSALLYITDWPLYEPDEMAIVSALRLAHGERRPFLEAPGHVFESSERDLLIGMFSLTVFYHWTAHLYCDQYTTALNWEGDLMDLWTLKPEVLSAAEISFGQA